MSSRNRTTETDFIEIARLERLAQQQSPARLGGEIGSSEDARPFLGFQERRTGAVDDVDRLAHAHAAIRHSAGLLAVATP